MIYWFKVTMTTFTTTMELLHNYYPSNIFVFELNVILFSKLYFGFKLSSFSLNLGLFDKRFL